MQQNDEMINTLKTAYNSLFAKGGSRHLDVAAEVSDKLKNITRLAENSEGSLKKPYFNASKKNAREILTQLAMSIGATAEKAHNNITRYLMDPMPGFVR